MSVKRVPSYPYPSKLDTTEDISAYIRQLHGAIARESHMRLVDFNILDLANVPYVDAREYGADGDDSTDNTTALQAALTAGQGGIVHIPAGVYQFTALTVEKDTIITGVSGTEATSLGTVLKCTASSGSAITINGTTSASRKRVHFRDLMLYGNANLDVGFDIQSTATVNPAMITMSNVEIRNMTKASSKAIYLKDASNVYLDSVRARYGTIAGYGLYLDNESFNGGPCVAVNCEFGQVNESVGGLYYAATSNHYQCFVFTGCYFGAGSSGVNGYPIYIAAGTPENFIFDGCALESKNETANASCMRIAGNTKHLTVRNTSFTGFDVVDFGVRVESGTHNSLYFKNPRFLTIQTTCMKVESGATFTDSEITGASRGNSATGWDGTFTGCLRQGFGQNKYLFGSEVVYRNPITLTDSDPTPSVAGGNFFKTNNANATDVTDFDDGTEGQEIIIRFADALTTVVHDTSYIFLQGAANWTPASGDTLTLIYEGTRWFEVSRSDNT